MKTSNFPSIGLHASHKLALRLVCPYVLFEVDIMGIGEEPRFEIKRIAQFWTRYMDMSSRIGVRAKRREPQVLPWRDSGRVAWVTDSWH